MLSIVVINGIGILLIASIVWWFWLYHPQAIQSANSTPIDIVVEAGTYTPNTIQARYHHPIRLRFIRKDASPCSEWVIFHGLDISQTLTLDKPTEITINPEQLGTFDFTCQMGMYRGKLIVTE